jgi:plastocyanin
VNDFRQRVLLPIVLPFGALVAIVGVAFSLSRVLLSISHTLAVFVALGAAGYILFLGFLIERRPRISSRALAVGTTLALLSVVGAGVVGVAAGAYEEPEAEAEGEAVAAGAGSGTVEEVPEGAPLFTAGQQLVYTDAPAEVPAGGTEIYLQLESLPHNVVFEGVNNDEPVVEGDAPGIFVGTVELEPGEHTYYCSIPGHREAGMEGTLTAS